MKSSDFSQKCMIRKSLHKRITIYNVHKLIHYIIYFVWYNWLCFNERNIKHSCECK